MPIKLTEISIPRENKDARTNLVKWACNTFRKSVESRSQQIDSDYRRWVDNYAAKPAQAIRTIPFYKASNFVPQLIRMHTDILAARQIGLLFGTRPFWMPKTFNSNIQNDVLMAVGEWMHKLCQYDVNFYDPVDLSVFLATKTGLSVIKNTWVDFSKTRAVSGQAVKDYRREGLCLDVIPFDDLFPYPITAQFFRDCLAIFHRLRFTKEEIDFRKHIPLPYGWNPKAADKLMMGSSTPNTNSARESAAQSAGINLTVDVIRPFTAVEMWGTYELEKGKLADIVLTFNPLDETEDSILKLHYNYLPPDLDPFVDIRIMPREGLIVGDCVPNILEQSQEEQAQIHNGRRDANLIANVPGWKKLKSYTGANPSTEWYPGKCFEVDTMEDINPLVFNTNYNSLIEEEQALLQLAERYTGISPAMQGFGSGTVGKKGIYSSQGTLALLSEGNKRLDIYLQRVRRSFHKQGQLIFTSYRDFRSGGKELELYGENGALLKQAFATKEPDDFRGVFFDLGASDASANKEVDRQNLLLMSNTMSAYYKEIMALAPSIAGMPEGSPAKELALQVLDGARDLANRILFVFDVWDRKKLVPDVREMLAGGKPQPRPRALDQAGVPESESAVSGSELQNLSRTVSEVTSAQRGPATQPQNGSRSVI